MGAKENLRYLVAAAGVSLFVVYASPKDTAGIDSIRLGSNNTIGPTPDMVVAKLGRDDLLTPTLTPVPTVGITPTTEPTHITNPEVKPTRVNTIPPENSVIIRPPLESTPVSEIIERQNDEWASEILYLTNEYRADNGRQPYKPDDRLKLAAEKYTAYYYKNGDLGYFTHYLCNDLGDCTPVQRAARERYIGNVGDDMGASYNSAAELFASFMGSTPHRAALLSASYSDVGVGCYQGIRYYEGRPYKWNLCVISFGDLIRFPTPYPTPDPTPEFSPTATVGPTPTSTPRPTATPTPVPTPTAEPSPTPTP